MLYVHRSERADRLLDALGDLLVAPLGDPMAHEVVAVPTRGVERWLTQRLSHRLGAGPGRDDGVCANIDFPFPGSLVGRATAVACGTDPDTDPWPPERSVWPLLDLVDSHLGEEWLAPLTAHLEASSPRPADAGGPGANPRRFPTVRHLADLYDRYGVHRPDMVRAWADGSDEGVGQPEDAWQAELWRRLRGRIGVPSPAERYATAAERLRAEGGLLELPGRLALFGLTRLPASHLLVLEAMAEARDVHLFLLHPSGVLWDAVAARLDGVPPRLARRDDPTAGMAAHPLLRSWGRDAREMQVVLTSHGVVGGEHRAVPEEPSSLLGLIQADVRADRRPPGPAAPGGVDRRPVLSEADHSLRIHSCHGRARQVEVVRDAVLHLLAADPELEPRDVIVMCPDIETFAPLVHAAFGGAEAMGPPAPDGSGPAGEEDDGLPRLRVRLADRSLRQTNPLLAVAARLLELAGSRVTASDVLDLASREPVARRFRLDEEDLSQMEGWVAGTGVRWGLDGAHRAPWKLAALDANTWAAGLDRLLLGVAMGEEDQRLFGDVLPLDDVPGTAVDLAGRVAELVARLGAALDGLAGRHPVGHWAARLTRATENLAEAGPGEAWQHDQLHRVLDEVVREAAGGRPGLSLDLGEVLSLLGQRLQGRPTRANFRTGDLTICTLVPMRSVPHRVVCLLGLDDGVFPRQTEHDGDDLLLADPRVGDRDARSEDRQLLLDALLAATDHLVITFNGRDQRTNQERPPAVPISELLDVVDRTVRTADGRRARDQVVVTHPLQSFDPRNFLPGVLRPGGPWGFDPVSRDGALALSGPRRPAAPFLAAPLPPLGRPVVQLESLVRFVEHPVRAFLRERLGLYAGREADPVSDALPLELGPLERWAVGDRLLEARLAGVDPQRALAAERGRGLLPPGELAEPVLDEIAPVVEGLVEIVASLPCAKAEPRSVEVNLRLPDGRSLVGTVPGVRDGTVLRCIYSRLGPKHRLAAWVRFLALSAARPDLTVSAATIGKSPAARPGRVWVAEIDAFEGGAEARAAAALAALARLVDLYDRGMCEPLPIYCATSAAWAQASRAGGEPAEAARPQWLTERNRPEQPANEDEDPDHVLVLGPRASLEDLRRERPAAGEAGAGWAEEETSRLGRLARRLWDGLLDHPERLGNRG